VLEYPEDNPERYEYEPWHWTYKPLSDKMKEGFISQKVNLCKLENVVRKMYGVEDLDIEPCNLRLPFHIDSISDLELTTEKLSLLN